MGDPRFYFKKKGELNKPKISRREEIIKSRNQYDKKKTIKKFNKAKNWKRPKKLIDIQLESARRERKQKQRTKIINISNEGGIITTDQIDIKWITNN